MTAIQETLAVLSGGVVGFTLGLIGGGGSILAVPLLLYVVGLKSPHLAIGTSAVAVAASATINLIWHARARNVKWPCAVVFATFGIFGAALGAQLGKAIDGSRLLGLFGTLMILIGVITLFPRKSPHDFDVRLKRENAARLIPLLALAGLAVGGLSGFFGIGGGFLVVPSLIGTTAMPLINAIGSSLVSVAAFGFTTALSYAASGLVDWTVAGLFILGGGFGGLAGLRTARSLATYKRALSLLFAGTVIGVGIYVIIRAMLG